MRPDAFAVRETELVMRWHDREVVFNGDFLRANCRCAGCRHLDITDNRTPHENISVLAVTPMGYGLQLHFSDGHNRGVYPWQYLRTLSPSSL